MKTCYNSDVCGENVRILADRSVELLIISCAILFVRQKVARMSSKASVI
jgi:hypothetical protein